MPEKTVRVGLIGCGAISGAYLKHAKSFPILDIVACADINLDAAKRKAEEFGIPKACSVGKLLQDDSIEIVLNLTIPKAHAHRRAQSDQGWQTHVLRKTARHQSQGRQTRARRCGGEKSSCRLRTDTFLGAGIQTARKLIDDRAIGKPVAFTAFMMCPGHESWHPNPAFYYDVGGGPMFNMGPYYLTALLNLLGPVKRMQRRGVDRDSRKNDH